MKPDYLSVTALTRYLKYIIEQDEHLQDVYLKGEVSNFKAHSRGHLYFSLKDEHSKINAIMFASTASTLKFKVEEGMKVLVRGRISLYEVSGNYQIYVTEMIEDGVGNLYIAFEQLKKKLKAEGLFSQARKKPLPTIPSRIGIITAPTGAAVRDIISTLNRRFPLSETILFPSLVQGAKAHLDLIKQLERAKAYQLDVIIIGRGGGSIEDLWPFNEEALARVISNYPVPIISAVGHEVDYTITDFVADVRAATPTGAAELAVPNMNDLLILIKNYQIRLIKSVRAQLKQNIIKLTKIKNSYVLKHPLNMYLVKEQKLDHLIDHLKLKMNNIIKAKYYQWEQLSNHYVFKQPKLIYEPKKQRLDHLLDQLIVLNPFNTLKRGYAIIKKEQQPVFNINLFKVKDEIEIILSEGELTAKIMEVEVKNDKGNEI